MEGVEEWEPCSRMGQCRVQGVGWGAQVPRLHTPSLCHPLHGAATIVIWEPNSSRRLVELGGQPGVVPSQPKRDLSPASDPHGPPPALPGIPQPPSCDLPWEGGACSPSRIHPQSSIPHPHLPKLPPMRTLQSSLQEAKSCIRCESYPLQSFMLCCNMAKCAPGVLQAFAWECQCFLLVCYTTCYVGHQQRAKELLHLPCLCVPELSLGLLEVC